jgi:NDP-sugar pyrophosphorylase family protein
MSVVGLLMAGGRSERMRAGGDTTHKSLRRVRGVTLLDHNIEALLGAPVDRIAIAISAAEPDLQRHIEEAVQPRCRAAAMPCDILLEHQPLGNIGAAKLAKDLGDHVLVIYVDNLTTLDLANLLAVHIARGRVATIAAHAETFTDPYGELTIERDDVVGYAEKPVRRVTVSSGTCVLAQAACAVIPDGVPTAAHQLFARLRERGHTIGAYRHSAPWVDVNDELSLRRAEHMLEIQRRSRLLEPG